MGPRRLTRSAPICSLGVLLAVIAVGGLIAACTDDSGSAAKKPPTTSSAGAKATTPAAGGLAGTAWSLENPVQAPSLPTLDFSTDGKVSGSTGCNRFAGTYRVEGEDLTIELGPMTKAACTSDAATQQENRIVTALGEVRSSQTTGTTLTLRDAQGKDLLSYAAVKSGLAGTSWKVLGVNNGRQAVVTSALTEKLTLEFGTDGTVSGNGGCNNFHGTYTQDGDSVKISELASTMMGCEKDVAELEQQYLSALQASTKATRSGNNLELRDDSGAMQVHAQLAG